MMEYVGFTWDWNEVGLSSLLWTVVLHSWKTRSSRAKCCQTLRNEFVGLPTFGQTKERRPFIWDYDYGVLVFAQSDAVNAMYQIIIPLSEDI